MWNTSRDIAIGVAIGLALFLSGPWLYHASIKYFAYVNETVNQLNYVECYSKESPYWIFRMPKEEPTK